MSKKKSLNFDHKLKDRIGEIILNVGSAEELSRRTGISAPTIGHYRSGRSDPSRGNLVAIAEAANVELLWLATGEGPKRKEDAGQGGIKEQPGIYKEQPVFYDTRIEPFVKAIGDLKEIFDSQDQAIITAIQANLFAGRRAAQTRSETLRLKEENKELKNKMNNLEARLAALEEKLSREATPGAIAG